MLMVLTQNVWLIQEHKFWPFSEGFAAKLGLKIFELNKLVDKSAFEGGHFGYKRYTFFNLKIPEIPQFDRIIHVFIMSDDEYNEGVLLLLGTLHIDMVLEDATKEQLMSLPQGWKRGSLGSKVLARMTQLRIDEKEKPMIEGIDSFVKLTKSVTIPPMQVHKTTGTVKVPILCKTLNMATEPLVEGSLPEGIETIESYETLKQGSNWLTIGIKNDTRGKVILKKGTKVARIRAANVVPPVVASARMDESELKYASGD